MTWRGRPSEALARTGARSSRLAARRDAAAGPPAPLQQRQGTAACPTAGRRIPPSATTTPAPPGAVAQHRASDFNFFPYGVTPNCNNGDCAFPGAWWKRNQTEYAPELLEDNERGILKIAVSDYYPAGPTLYVIPGAWCDSGGALADASSNGLKPRGSRRSLLAALAGKVRPGLPRSGGASLPPRACSSWL